MTSLPKRLDLLLEARSPLDADPCPALDEEGGRCVQIFKVEGGVITDTRLYFDQVQVMTLLGLMPEPAIA